MLIKVDRNLFLSELFYLQGLAAAKQLIPILSHIFIDACFDKLMMRATDLDVSITTECQADVREVGSICLPARKLMEIVKSLPQGEIEIKSDPSCHVSIVCHRSRFKLMGTNSDHFPELRQYTGEFSEVPAEMFLRFIHRVLHAVGQECSNYALNGVKLEISDERIRMVATDGHRMALVEHEGRFNKALDIILPKKTLVELAKICASSDEMLLLGLADNQIHFKLGKREIASCMLTGRYPDYSAVLPKSNLNRITLDRDIIYPAIKRVALMADDRSRAVKLEIGEGNMNISSRSAEHGEAVETIATGYRGEKITVGFNAVYLNDVINAFDEEEISLEIKNGESAALFTTNSPDQDRCLAIVMPLRF